MAREADWPYIMDHARQRADERHAEIADVPPEHRPGKVSVGKSLTKSGFASRPVRVHSNTVRMREAAPDVLTKLARKYDKKDILEEYKLPPAPQGV